MSELLGKRIMLLEDEAIIAFAVEDMLIELGCTIVGPALNLDDAMALATTDLNIDAAILDVNINNGRSYRVAQALEQRGVPFVFASGYDESGVAWDGEPVEIISKPYRKDQIERAIIEMLASI